MSIFQPNILANRINRFLFALLVAILIIGGFCAYRAAMKPLNPTQWYFWTEQNSGADANLPNHKITLNHEYNEPGALWTRDPFGVCNDKAIAALVDRHVNPPASLYRGVWLCNDAAITGDEFNEQVLHFKEKVDEIYSDYHGEIISGVMANLAGGFLAWLLVAFSFFTINWIKRGTKS